MLLKHLIITLTLFLITKASAQVSAPNIDFELGNTTYWRFDTGTCCPLALTGSILPALSGRHELQIVGSWVDVYGGFPVVSPDGGNYSLKLGNDHVGGEAESAEYTVHVPTGSTTYSVIFRYAVVFENPGHLMADQPRFVVSAIDSADGSLIECAQYLYVASSGMSGFHDSPADTSIKYKEWTTASIDLTSHAGKTIKVRFSTGDCALGGHFGYGYIDVSTGLFAVSTYSCSGRVTLTGPSGFDYYYWYDNSFTLVGTGKEISVDNVTGTTPKTYAVVLMPYPGYGCPDTLYTTVYPKTYLNTAVQIDCAGKDVILTAPGGASSYSWYDSTYTSLLGTGTSIVLHDLTGPEKHALIMIGDTTTGCPDTVMMTVNPAVEPDSIIAAAYCNNDAELSVKYGNSKFYWYNNGGLVDTGKYLYVKDIKEPTTYMLVIKPDTGMICMDTLYHTVTPRPPDRHWRIRVENCNKNELVITGPNGYPHYMWQDGETMEIIGNVKTLELPNPERDKNFILTLRANTLTECYDTLRARVSPSHLEPVLQEDRHVCKGKILTLKAEVKGNTGNLSYSWEPAAAVNCPSCEQTKTHVEDGGEYNVTIRDEAGCSVSDTVQVSLDTCLLVLPNAFTPNGDGKNDVFRVTGTGFEWFQTFSFSVYNRFGQRVYSTTSIDEGWNGVFNETHQDVGTYFYMVIYTLNDETFVLKGDVTLVR